MISIPNDDSIECKATALKFDLQMIVSIYAQLTRNIMYWDRERWSESDNVMHQLKFESLVKIKPILCQYQYVDYLYHVYVPQYTRYLSMYSMYFIK